MWSTYFGEFGGILGRLVNKFADFAPSCIIVQHLKRGSELEGEGSAGY
jgi:hypothetical protein